MTRIDSIIRVLRRETNKFKVPIVTKVAQEKKGPFCVLISCLLSLRTKDNVTAGASLRLFRLAHTPDKLLKIPLKTIEKLIYPVGFYHNKAKTIHGICRDLILRFKGRVPDDLDKLLTFKGVGRKTANLVLTLGYHKLGICVDTHVYRISNRLGIVKTVNPEATEFALRKVLPKRYWIEYNDLLVMWGQNVCVPISPFCSKCAIIKYCPRCSVVMSR